MLIENMSERIEWNKRRYEAIRKEVEKIKKDADKRVGKSKTAEELIAAIKPKKRGHKKSPKSNGNGKKDFNKRRK